MGLHVVTDQNQRDLRELDTTWDGGSDQIKYNQDSVCPPGPCRNNSTEWHFAKQTITVFPCLWLFPAGIQVSFITRINGKPLKRVWSTRNQQTSAAVAEVCTLTFSFTAFCLGPHQEASPRQVCGAQKHPLCKSMHPLLPKMPCPGSPAAASLPTPQVRFPRAAPQGAHTDTQTQWEPPTGNSNKNMAVYSKKANSFTKVSSVEEEWWVTPLSEATAVAPPPSCIHEFWKRKKK